MGRELAAIEGCRAGEGCCEKKKVVCHLDRGVGQGASVPQVADLRLRSWLDQEIRRGGCLGAGGDAVWAGDKSPKGTLSACEWSSLGWVWDVMVSVSGWRGPFAPAQFAFWGVTWLLPRTELAGAAGRCRACVLNRSQGWILE